MPVASGLSSQAYGRSLTTQPACGLCRYAGGASPLPSPGSYEAIADVKVHFGAAGNGITDDTAAFQRAIAQITKRGVLYIPPGAKQGGGVGSEVRGAQQEWASGLGAKQGKDGCWRKGAVVPPSQLGGGILCRGGGRVTQGTDGTANRAELLRQCSVLGTSLAHVYCKGPFPLRMHWHRCARCLQ
jgi:hypothetical protein